MNGDDIVDDISISAHSANNVKIPDGPFNPTNYSGTQVNFWGVAPGNIPPFANGLGGGFSVPYANTDTELGYMTNRMLMVCAVVA